MEHEAIGIDDQFGMLLDHLIPHVLNIEEHIFNVVIQGMGDRAYSIPAIDIPRRIVVVIVLDLYEGFEDVGIILVYSA